MLVDPLVLALLVGSVVVLAGLVIASAQALMILWRWDPRDPSPRQIALERRTYLVSALVGWIMVLELLSLALFVLAGEDLHDLFVGAMCAAGTFNAADTGYPTLLLKLVSGILCGVWLIVNAADTRAPDYPLILPKYKLLLVITGLVGLEAVLQWDYFSQLAPDLITSCCGTLFSEDAASVAGGLAHLNPTLMEVLFFGSVLGVLRVGGHVIATGRGATALAWTSGAALVIALASIISFIGVYFYELPTHHCPFCLLQPEYGYVGYPLYASMLLGGICGVGAGVLERLRGPASLAAVIPAMQRRLAWWAMGGFVACALIALWPMLFSDFKLGGY